MSEQSELIKEVEEKLPIIAKTGKIVYGANDVKWTVSNKRTKLVILASNCPRWLEEEIKSACEKKRVSIVRSSLNNLELGKRCLRPHIVAAVAILDFGVLSEALEGKRIA